MTVITIATVGFSETRPLSDPGKVFTIGLIISGVATLSFGITLLVEFFVEGQLTGYLEGRQMTKRLQEMSGHTIVAGLGRVGSVVASTLHDEGAPFVVVDSADDVLAWAREHDWPYVEGDATEEETLSQAGIERAAALVTALDTDAQNLFVTVTARALNADLFIVSRCSHASTEAKLIKAGANRVITPNVIGGRRMASMVLHPFVSDYLDLVAHGQDLEFRLQEVELGAASVLAGRSIAESRVRETTGAYILAVRRLTGEVDTNPSPDSLLSAGDTLVVLGTAQQCAALRAEV